MPIKINMRSAADCVKGQGVGSCFLEQVKLVKNGLNDKDFEITVNSIKQCDIIHFHTINFDYFLERIIKGKNIVAIAYVHFIPETLDDSLKLPKFIRKILYKYLIVFYNSMDYLVVVNPTIRTKLLSYDIKKPKIIYIPNFVSDEEFNKLDTYKKSEIRKKYNIEDDKFVVLSAGQLQTRKGIFDFVETANRMPDALFVWAGGFSFGSISDGYEDIKKIVNNPPKNLRFLGIVEREEMNNIYNMSDLMFLASFDELFPMTILEAMSCQLPILLRDIIVYEEILKDSYLKGKTVDDFVNIIKEVKSNLNLKELYAKKSLTCHTFYNKEKVLSLWQNLYTEAYEYLKNRKKLKKTEFEDEKIY